MQVIVDKHVNIHQENSIYNDVVVEIREQIPEITGYLENTSDRLQSLKYILDDTFDAKEALIYWIKTFQTVLLMVKKNLS